MKRESNPTGEIELIVKRAMNVCRNEHSESGQYPETGEFIKQFPSEIRENLIERIDIYRNFDFDALVQYMRERSSQNDNENLEEGYARFRKRIPDIKENILTRIREIKAARK